MTVTIKTVEAFCAEWEKYDQSGCEFARTLTDAELVALLDASEHTGLGGDELGRTVVTREGLVDFETSRQNHWNERGSRKEISCQGYPAIHYKRVQMLKGQPRRDFVVVDLGDRRIVVGG